MAGNIPAGSMSTEIKLNGSQSVHTLRELKQAVTQATSAWKAQRAELSSIGKSTQAAETKYRGLAETVKKQKDYISGLQSEQRHLEEAQKSVDRSTREGQQEYGKYNEALQKNETRIHSAETRLTSLTNQQSKARKSLDYYKSGLADAQKQLKSSSELTRSYVDRLQAEGKTYEASRAKLNGYKDSVENLSKQEKIQEQELNKIASESGKTSDAYKRQQIRVNETATSLAKAKTQMHDLNETMQHSNPSFLDRIKNKLNGVNKEADETHHTFRDVFMGSALGNALSNSLSNIGSGLLSAYHNGMDLNLALSKVNGRFHDMGLSRRQISAMDKQMSELKGNTLMTGENVANVQSKMLGWSNIGTKGAMQMTKMIAGVGDSSRITGDQVEQLGIGLTHVGSTGKVTYSALNRVTKLAPTFMTQLARGAGMSEGKLKALLRTGKVTQTQFQRWMANAAKYSNTAFSKFGTTQAGAMEKIKSKWDDLERKMTAPIFSAKTTGLQALKDLLTSKTVTNGAKAIGNGIANVIHYLDEHKKDISDSAKDLLSITGTIAKDVWNDFAGIVTDIGKSFGLIHDNAKKSGGPLHSVRLALDGLAKNKTAVKVIADTLMVVAGMKFANAIGGLFHINKLLLGATNAASGLAKGLKGIEDTSKLKGVEKHFAKLGQLIRKTTKFSVGKRLGVGATAGAVVAAPEVVNAIRDRHSATNRSKDIGGGIGAIAGGALTSLIPVVGPLLAPVGAVIGKYAGRWGGQAVDSFTKGWQKNKPPKKFWSLENLGWSMHNMAKQTNAGFNSWAKSLKRGFNNAKKGFNNFHKSVNRNISNFVRAARKKYNQIATAPAKAFKKGWNEAYKHSSKGTKQIMRSTENFAKNYVKIHQKANRETIKNFASFGKRLKKNHGDLFKTIGQTAKTQLKIEEQKWSSSWKNIRSFTTGVWRGINLNAHSFYNSLNKSTHGGLGKVFSAFESFGKGIASFWRGLWKGIENFFNGIWHGIIDQIKDVRKVLSHIHIGSLHLASGTDWRKRYGVPAVVNDAPGSDYREGLLDHGNLIPFPAKRNLPFWLLPGQDVVNGHDMANMFDRAIHYANGTVDLRASGSRYQISRKNLLPTIVGLLKTNIQVTDARHKKYDLLLEDYKEHRDKLDRRRDKKDSDYLGDKQKREKAEKASRADSAKMAKLGSALIVAVKDGHKKEAEKLANEISKLKKDQSKQNKIASTSIRDLQANTTKRKAAAKQVTKDKSELKKLGDQISKAMKHHDTSEAKKLTTKFNAISKDLSKEKSLAKKPNPHQGQTFVDEGLLLGAHRRIGHSEWISTKLFNKLTSKKKKRKKRKTRKRKARRRRRTTELSSRTLSSIRKLLSSRTSKRKSSETLRSLRKLLSERTTRRRRTSTRRRRSTSTTRRRTTTRRRSSTRSISLSGLTRSASSVRASATGAKTIKALAKSIKAIKSKHVKVSVKASGSKALKSLAKYVKRIKSSKHRVTVKTKGTKALKALHKAVKAIKGSTHYVRVKTSGVKQLKELQKNITEVHKRVDSLTKALKKDTFGKDIAKQAEEAVKSLKGNGNFTKVISKMTKDSTKDFKSMVKSINKDADSMAKTTKGDYSKMHKNILASMKSIYSGVNRFAKQTANAFNNALHKMIGYAKNDMQSTIRQINRGIRGINTVLVQFGGNKSVIKYAHFAKGTDANGRLTHDTWAVVNDATSGPKQEAVVTDKNDIILPKGNNQPMLLKKGWGVLNGTQTESLSLPHFAKGSGLSHSALRKLAKRSLEHFARAFEQMFTNHVNSQGQDVQKDFTNLSKSAGTHYGNPWSQAIWTVINNAIGDAGLGGTREAFLKYAERVFSGVPYQLGAASKRLSDCSGMVMQALRHFHIYIGRDTVSMADSSGTEYLGKSLSKTVPGDLVIFGHGTGAAGHVGIIKNPAKGTMFNETQPYAHVSKISDDTGMGYGFYRIKGLHNASKKHGKGPSKDLLSLARHELGAKAIKWIKDHLGEETGLIGAFKLTGDVGDRARAIARALKKAVPGATKSGLAAVIGSWLFESGSLNPSAVNPDGGASGFGQWLGIRKTRLIAYAKRHGKSWRNPALQLSFALHGDTGMTGIFRRILTGHGSPSSLANAFSNEWEKGGYNAQHAAGAESVYRMLKHFANGGIATTPSIFGEAGPEMAIPLIPTKATRAWELIGKTIGILASQSGLNTEVNQETKKEQKEEHDFRQAVILLLTQLLGKSNVAKITLTTPAGRALWSVIKPFARAEDKAEIMRLRRRLASGR